MKIIKEGSVTLKNENAGTTIQRDISILEAYNHFVVVNVDEASGWLETKYISRSHMFDNETLANKWFDKLCKDENL